MATTSECVLNASRRLDAFAVRDLIEAVYDCDDPTVFINMSATTFIDEVAVHAIRRAAASFERTRRELLIVWPSEAVTFTLKLLGIQLDIWPRRGGSDAWAGSGPLSA